MKKICIIPEYCVYLCNICMLNLFLCLKQMANVDIEMIAYYKAEKLDKYQKLSLLPKLSK